MKNGHIHTAFKLNGESFQNKNDLIGFTKIKYPDIAIFLSHWFDDSEFITVQTSGSTGIPKGIKLKKEFMKNSAIATGEFFNIKVGTTALLCLSTNFIAGKMMLVRALVLGWHLDVIDPVSNPLQENEKQYDFTAMVPMQLFHSLKNLSNIKTLIVGGGLVSNDLQTKLKKITTKVYATYGMTETITHIAVKPLNYAAGRLKTKDVYCTLPSVVLGIDSRNCLVIDAPNISEKKLVTNDIVTLISQTEFRWLGRFDNIINSGGVKLIPEQIESILNKIIKQRFFISSTPDIILGEKLILVCEGPEQNNILQNIINFQKVNKNILSKLEVPKKIYFVQYFIETGSNKISRKETLNMIKI